MEHNRAFVKLSAFLDKQLDIRTAGEVSRHIAQCGQCQAELEALKRTDETVLAAGKQIEYDPYFKAKLMGIIKEGKTQRAQTFKWLPVPVALAMLLLVFSGVMLTAPVVYGGQEDIKGLAIKAFIPDSPEKIFSPANYLELCRNCSAVMCGHCKNMGPNSNCMMKGCNHEQK